MKIEFIIPTYHRQDKLMCVISSIVAQNSNMWSIHVVADCPPEGSLDKIIKFYEDDNRIRFTILKNRYNDWGHTPRNYGLDHAKEDWVVMTGDDNYYTPAFVENMLSAVTENTHFVHCDMVHNWLNNAYVHLVSEAKLHKIDIGNFMSKPELAKQVKLQIDKWDADGIFVEEYLEKFPNGEVKHIPKILYVHN